MPTNEQRLRRVVVKSAGCEPSQIQNDTDLAEHPFWFDSLDSVEMIMMIEDEFKIQIEECDAGLIMQAGSTRFSDILYHTERLIKEQV